MANKNPGNFANRPREAVRKAGQKGAKNQSMEAKRRGGMNSHKNR